MIDLRPAQVGLQQDRRSLADDVSWAPRAFDTWVDNGPPCVVPSAMSKAGIEAMTKSLAIE